MSIETPLTFLEISEYIKAFGIGYLSGVGYLFSDLFRVYSSPKATNNRFAKVVTETDRRSFGWGAEDYRTSDDANPGTKSRVRGALLLMTILGGVIVLNALNSPTAALALGLLCLAAGLSTRRKLQRRKGVSLLEFDGTTLAFDLLFIVMMT
ncbi:MAG: hypothetical protein AB3N15_10165 [Paracoccaceae bacterium]